MPTITNPTRFVWCQFRERFRAFVATLMVKKATSDEYETLPTGDTTHTQEWLEAVGMAQTIDFTRDVLYQTTLSLPPDVLTFAGDEIEAANTAMSALAGKLESFPQT
jgi:hypothetical protein